MSDNQIEDIPQIQQSDVFSDFELDQSKKVQNVQKQEEVKSNEVSSPKQSKVVGYGMQKRLREDEKKKEEDRKNSKSPTHPYLKRKNKSIIQRKKSPEKQISTDLIDQYTQVNIDFVKALQKFQNQATIERGMIESQMIIRANLNQNSLRVFIFCLQQCRKQAHDPVEHEMNILVIGFLCQTFKHQLIDPIDKQPDLLQTAFRITEMIHSYFEIATDGIKLACFRSTIDLLENCLNKLSVEDQILIIFEPLASLIGQGVNILSQKTASQLILELIKYFMQKQDQFSLKLLTKSIITLFMKNLNQFNELITVTGLIFDVYADKKAIDCKMNTITEKLLTLIQIDSSKSVNHYQIKIESAIVLQKIAKCISKSPAELKAKINNSPQILETLYELKMKEKSLRFQTQLHHAYEEWCKLYTDSDSLENSPSPQIQRKSQSQWKNLNEVRDMMKIQKQKNHQKPESNKKQKSQDVYIGLGVINQAQNFIKKGTGQGGGFLGNIELSESQLSNMKQSHEKQLQSIKKSIVENNPIKKKRQLSEGVKSKDNEIIQIQNSQPDPNIELKQLSQQVDPQIKNQDSNDDNSSKKIKNSSKQQRENLHMNIALSRLEKKLESIAQVVDKGQKKKNNLQINKLDYEIIINKEKNDLYDEKQEHNDIKHPNEWQIQQIEQMKLLQLQLNEIKEALKDQKLITNQVDKRNEFHEPITNKQIQDVQNDQNIDDFDENHQSISIINQNQQIQSKDEKYQQKQQLYQFQQLQEQNYQIQKQIQQTPQNLDNEKLNATKNQSVKFDQSSIRQPQFYEQTQKQISNLKVNFDQFKKDIQLINYNDEVDDIEFIETTQSAFQYPYQQIQQKKQVYHKNLSPIKQLQKNPEIQMQNPKKDHWYNALLYLQNHKIDKAYQSILEQDDDTYLIRLMIKTSPCLNFLPVKIQKQVLNKLNKIIESRFIEKQFLNLLEQSLEFQILNNFSIEDQNDVVGILNEINLNEPELQKSCQNIQNQLEINQKYY